MREHAHGGGVLGGRHIRMFNSGGGAVPVNMLCAQNAPDTSHGNAKKNGFVLASQFLSEDDDDDGSSSGVRGGRALHELCQDPINTTVGDVIASIAVRPKHVETADENGRKPLFHAIRKGLSLDIIKVLFKAYPNAMVEPDSFSEVPIYMLYLPTADCSILEWVLEQQPSLTQYRRRCGSLSLVESMSLPWERVGDREFRRASVDGWKKMVVTVRAAHAHLSDATPEWSFSMPQLHVMLEYTALSQTSAHLLCRFLDMYQDQVLLAMSTPIMSPGERSASDMLPLHYFLKTQSFPARRAQQKPIVAALTHMLRVYPGACAVSGPDGRFPLHLALQNGYSWTEGCVADMVLAYDGALDVFDPESRRLPFLLADDITDIYALLRENPVAVAHAFEG